MKNLTQYQLRMLIEQENLLEARREEKFEKLAITKPIKERLELTRGLLK
jgi:hypothetical protein